LNCQPVVLLVDLLAKATAVIATTKCIEKVLGACGMEIIPANSDTPVTNAEIPITKPIEFKGMDSIFRPFKKPIDAHC
jgi:hypothetical protein